MDQFIRTSFLRFAYVYGLGILLLAPALARAQSPEVQAAKQFTQLMILSFGVVVGLWILVWWKRKKRPPQ